MSDDWAPVVAAVDAQRAELDAVLASVVAQLRREVSEYAVVPAESLAALCRRNISIGLRAYRERRPYAEDEVAAIVSTVAARARQGVPLDAVLRAFRVVENASFRDVERRVPRLPPDTLRDLWTMRFANMEAMTGSAASAHRAVELEQTAELQARQALALKALLTGSLVEADATATLSSLGMDTSRAHWVYSLKGSDDLSGLLRRVSSGEARAPRAVFTTWDELVVGLTADPPPEDMSFADGGVAGPVLVSDVHRAYVEADRARRSAAAFGQSGIRTRRQLGLRAAVVEDPIIGQALHDKYVVPLNAAGALADELLTTARVYLEHGGRRELAARALHLHPNTLGYRLGRFVHFTGAELDNHEVVAELWWLFRHLEVVGRQPLSV